MYNNNNTIILWEKLINSLINGTEEYKKLQKEVENKYYNEILAKAHLEKHYKLAQQINEKFRCHTFENFTTLSYINVANNCQIENKANNSKTS